MNIEIEVRDPLFYYSDEYEQNSSLRVYANRFFKNNDIDIISEIPQDDSITCVVEKRKIDDLLSSFFWEQTSDEYIFIYISERLEISFNPNDHAADI